MHLCVPFPHRFSPPPAPPFPSGWDCLWGLTGIFSMPWARSGLLCLFHPVGTCPPETLHVVPGGLAIGMGATLGHKLPLKGKKDGSLAFTIQEHHLLSVLLDELLIGGFQRGQETQGRSAQRPDFRMGLLSMPARPTPRHVCPLRCLSCFYPFFFPTRIHRHLFSTVLKCSLRS